MESERPLHQQAVAFFGFASVVLLLFAIVGCGGSSGPRIATLSLATTASSIHVNSTAHFTVPGHTNADVQQWVINGITGGAPLIGTIDPDGTYHAPAVPPDPNTVVVMAFGPQFSASAEIMVVNPAPQVVAVSPGIAMQDTSSMSLTVTGSGFTTQSTVLADGVPAETTFLSSDSLRAILPDEMMQASGAHAIAVQTPQPGGGTSSTSTLTVMAKGAVRPSQHPLVALYDIAPPPGATVTVEFGPDTSYGRSTSSVTTPAGGGAVEVQVAGMLASSSYHMRARVTLADGTTLFDDDQTFTTGAVPTKRLPNLTVTNFNGASPNPGIELLDMIPVRGTNPLAAAAVDLDGQLLWYYDPEPGTNMMPLKLLPNGHFLLDISNYVNHANDSLREIDLAGNIIRDFKRTDLNAALAAHGFALTVDQFHHDVLLLPNGHIILLCNVTRQVDGLTGYSGPTAVQGDILVDLDPNLVPVWTWSAFDHLDPNRHLQGLPDWTHSNALVYTPNDGNLLLSIRHQSWVIKIDYANGAGSGAILWRFGDEGDFTLTSGDRSAWQYGQHYPRVLSIDGTKIQLAVMDNGNLRIDANGIPCVSPGTPTCYSRLAIFDLDEQSRTVTPVWEYRPPYVYSYWGGSVEQLGNGNLEGAFSAAAGANTGSRIVEVTPGDNPQPVWQMDLAGESIYRGFRIPSLYPGVQW
jgi:hypothetical protein